MYLHLLPSRFSLDDMENIKKGSARNSASPGANCVSKGAYQICSVDSLLEGNFNVLEMNLDPELVKKIGIEFLALAFHLVFALCS